MYNTFDEIINRSGTNFTLKLFAEIAGNSDVSFSDFIENKMNREAGDFGHWGSKIVRNSEEIYKKYHHQALTAGGDMCGTIGFPQIKPIYYYKTSPLDFAKEIENINPYNAFESYKASAAFIVYEKFSSTFGMNNNKGVWMKCKEQSSTEPYIVGVNREVLMYPPNDEDHPFESAVVDGMKVCDDANDLFAKAVHAYNAGGRGMRSPWVFWLKGHRPSYNNYSVDVRINRTGMPAHRWKWKGTIGGEDVCFWWGEDDWRTSSFNVRWTRIQTYINSDKEKETKMATHIVDCPE